MTKLILLSENLKRIIIIALFNSEKEDKSFQWFEKAKEKGLEDLSEISNDFFSKSIDDWIKKAKFWGPIRVEENSYKED